MRHPRNRSPTHPGLHLRSAILQRKLTPEAIANSLGMSIQQLTAITKGKRCISPDTAFRLEEMTSVSAEFWLNSQLAWDLWGERGCSKAASHPC